LAVSKESAVVKKFESEIAGDVDILMVPTIEVGNGIGKTLTYLAGAESAGIIMGAKVPVVLVSRADSYEAKLYSIALGSVISSYQSK
jgi:phosphate butyryltransferase